MSVNNSKIGDLYYKEKCVDLIVLEKGNKFYIVTSYEHPKTTSFMAQTRRIKDIGYVCAWKIAKPLYIFEVELTKDINIIELRSPSDIVNLHSCIGIDFKLKDGLWDNYHTLDALKEHPKYDGWIEYPTAEPGRPLGIEIAITNPSLVKFTGAHWTLENLLVENADEFECIDSGLVTDLKQGNSNAIEFAKTMLLDLTKILNNY